MISKRDVLLQEILSQPSAPFREGHVIHRIVTELKAGKVPHFIDPVGNIEISRKKAPEPLRIFIAHMDHPGFHGEKWTSKSELEVIWHGGSPTQHLEGAKVWVSDRAGWVGEGKMKNAKLMASGKALESATIVFSDEMSADAKSLFGGFGFRSPWWRDGDMIYTKAADDLVGSFAVTSMALDYFKKPKRTGDTPFIGLLTRAEEVGFIGALAHFELGWLAQAKRNIICVSLETSRTLPGAEIGKGPVVRLGDKTTVFDAGALRVFSDVAEAALPGKHQRRIMDGGTCEATAATVYGYPCIGISVPLGNYHNQSFEGGPDAAPTNGPAPEFIHYQDIAGLIELCHALLKPKLPWATPWQEKMKQFKKDLKKYGALLRSDP
jgi:putative aminopeptidase FrvX